MKIKMHLVDSFRRGIKSQRRPRDTISFLSNPDAFVEFSSLQGLVSVAAMQVKERKDLTVFSFSVVSIWGVKSGHFTKQYLAI